MFFMDCHCQKYLTPIQNIDEIRLRCKVSSLISLTMEEVASDFLTWISVYQCKSCKRFWAREYYLHAGTNMTDQMSCFYHIDCDNPFQWLKQTKSILKRFNEG